MDPNRVLEHIRADHDRLRSRFDAIEYLAKDIIDGWRDDIHLLIRVGELMLSELFDHMRWEEEHLAPALRTADTQGEDRAARLAEDHREQRMLLRYELERLRDPAIPKLLLSRNLLDYLELLRRDMQEEERWMLDLCPLRNEFVGVEVTTG